MQTKRIVIAVIAFACILTLGCKKTQTSDPNEASQTQQPTQTEQAPKEIEIWDRIPGVVVDNEMYVSFDTATMKGVKLVIDHAIAPEYEHLEPEYDIKDMELVGEIQSEVDANTQPEQHLSSNSISLGTKIYGIQSKISEFGFYDIIAEEYLGPDNNKKWALYRYYGAK